VSLRRPWRRYVNSVTPALAVAAKPRSSGRFARGKAGLYAGSRSYGYLNADHLQIQRQRQLQALDRVTAAHRCRVFAARADQQISLVRQAVLAPLEYCGCWKALREPAVYMCNTNWPAIRRQPQPLDATEAAWWAQALRLWQEFIAAYAVCLVAHVRGDSGVRNYGALIVMRCLRYTSSAMFEHYRVYRHAPGEL